MDGGSVPLPPQAGKLPAAIVPATPPLDSLVRPREEVPPEFVGIPESPSEANGSQDVLPQDTEMISDQEDEEEEMSVFFVFRSGDTTALTVSKDTVKHQIMVLGGGSLSDGLNKALWGGGKT